MSTIFEVAPCGSQYGLTPNADFPLVRWAPGARNHEYVQAPPHDSETRERQLLQLQRAYDSLHVLFLQDSLLIDQLREALRFYAPTHPLLVEEPKVS